MNSLTFTICVGRNKGNTVKDIGTEFVSDVLIVSRALYANST